MQTPLPHESFRKIPRLYDLWKFVFVLRNCLQMCTCLHKQLLAAAATAAKSIQWCPTLCDPRDGSPPGSPIPGILQARTLEWVAIAFSNA